MNTEPPFERDETERLRAAFASPQDVDAVSGDCLSPEDLLAAVRDELPPAELRRVLAHVAECAPCTEAWRLAQALEEETEASPASAHLSGRPAWRRAAGLLAAAAVILVVGVVVQSQWADQISGPEPITRAGGVAELALEVGADPLPRDACLLRWTALAGARYDVRVSTQDLDTLAKAVDLDGPEYLVSADDLPAADPNAELGSETLLVYIEAHRPGEGTVASGTFAFTVR